MKIVLDIYGCNVEPWAHDLLYRKGAEVHYHDNYVPSFPKMREHHFDLNSVELTTDNLNTYDCVVLATDHDNLDYEMIKNNAKLIIDTRGKYLENESHIVKA